MSNFNKQIVFTKDRKDFTPIIFESICYERRAEVFPLIHKYTPSILIFFLWCYAHKLNLFKLWQKIFNDGLTVRSLNTTEAIGWKEDLPLGAGYEPMIILEIQITWIFKSFLSRFYLVFIFSF